MDVFQGVPQFELSNDKLEGGLEIISFLAEETSIFPSKGEARKMVQGNGVSINKSKVDLNKQINKADLIAGKLILAQKGKRNYFLINVV
jgi:tyrosyl-tRNA synthetase